MEKEEYRRMFAVEDSFWWYVGMRRITAALLDPIYLPRRNGGIAILDAGCGTGANLLFLRRYGQACGIDASEEAIAFCHERGIGQVAPGTVEQLPYPDCSFDLVTSFDVIYHASIQDDLQVLREFRRVLKPGGRLLLRIAAYDWLRGEHDLVVHSRHRYTVPEVREKLRQAGFQPERVSYANMTLFPVAVAKRLAESFMLRLPRRATTPHSDLAPLPAPLNRALTTILSIEAPLIRRANLPFGLSVIALARA